MGWLCPAYLISKVLRDTGGVSLFHLLPETLPLASEAPANSFHLKGRGRRTVRARTGLSGSAVSLPPPARDGVAAQRPQQPGSGTGQSKLVVRRKTEI